jgi:signal transduction histidine kinase/AraC-like DNA-binding protein/DNA-binding response OmpR family regulator/ABC-type sugar transport system substrate-binding protein
MMSHILRIGSAIDPVDPYWVQVREAAYERAEQLPLDLISISLVDYPETLPEERQVALLEELLALELDALIAWSLPEDLAYNILQFGLPLILLSETEVRHPLLVSPPGLYDIAQIGSNHLVEKLSGKGNVLALGGLIRVNWRDESTSWIAGIRDVFRHYPYLNLKHVPTPRVYEQAYSEIYKAMQRIDEPIDAIFGLSDTVALIGREAGQEFGLLDQQTLIAGIGGTPSALAAITAGNMTATVDILTDELGKQAVDLACQAAQDQPLPTHFDYKSRLVTAQNVAEVAAQKLVAIANLPSRLVGVRRRQQQERLKQLETSLEISRRVGSILDHRQLSHEIANLIRASYGYDRVQIFHWVEDEQLLILDQPDQAQASPVSIPVTGSGVLGQALMHNEPIFIPDTRRSPRFAPDPWWPNTRTRVVLPIRLGDKVLGLLDLHSNQSTLRARQELVGLQSLADQLGIAMSNADLYGEALKARAEAEKADQLKTRLLANVSHELRTPLNTILGYMKTALDSAHTYHVDLPTTILKDLQHVYHSAEHLLHVINDLLDLSRAEIGELAVSPEMMAPQPFLTEVFHSIANSAAAQGDLSWRLQLPDRLPTIQADPVRLRQILLNLLSNACKFTDTGEIVLGAEVTPPHLHLWIQDTGVGIPVEQQERIFEPFTTAEHVSRRREGIGLGLTITRQLVALHRGSMTLESQPGQGSTFHVYLPLPSLSEQPAPLPSTSTQPVLLLISAQEQPAREIVELSHCQRLEIRRLQASDDVDAMLRGLQPAALAWDLTSANANDWTVVQRLRNHPQLCHVPFILYGQNQSDRPAMTLGMTHLVTKPVSGKTLIETINALCPPQSIGSILIIDDDPQACELYRGMVAKGLPGYPIRTASDGTAALVTMAEAPPSLVILDLMMPEMDGFEVLDWMRANQQTRQVPVLILSGRMLTLEDIKRLERHARATFQSKDILSEEETTAALQRMLFDTDALPPHTSALVKRAVAYFQQNYHRHLSREEIARAIGVSKNYLSHIFRQEVGLSPWEYLNRYRIKQAKDLLSRTNDSVTEVALQVGFNNPAYFSRMFHKQIGLSPSTYRENAK